MATKWTHDDYVKFVHVETEGFEVVGMYVNNSTKVEMRHAGCGRDFSIRPADFKRRKRCSLCNIKRKFTTSEYKAQVAKITDNAFEILGEYVRDSDKILTKHKVCGFEWGISPTHLKGGKRCPKCSGRVRKDTEYFRQEVFEIVGDEYEVRSEYRSAHEKVAFFHNSDVCGGTVFKMTPDSFLSGRRCHACADIARSGENHWNYNPNLTEEERQRRDMFNGEIRKWRDQIYARDDYTCQLCEEKGGKLNAHHLNSWDKHPDDRFELPNGITLCETCHKDFHGVYGYGSNTAEQFVEYATR